MASQKRYSLKNRTLENDIKYRGFLSYRYVRIIAWFILVLAAVGTVVKFNIKISPDSKSQIGWISDATDFISDLPVALFMLANFAFIFQRRDSWKQLLTFYGGVALLMYIAGNVLILHYGFGIANTFFGKTDVMALSRAFGTMMAASGKGYVFNIFIDLLLCSLIFFFSFYTPKGGFKERWQLILFRCGMILPVLYEVGSVIFKYQVIVNGYQIPHFIFFLLTSKPPLMIIAFFLIVLFAKLFEINAIKRKGEEFAKEHAKTNAHSLRFSIMISIVFLVISIVDLFLFIFFSVILAKGMGGSDTAVEIAMNISQTLGFGNSMTLALIIPIVILFSYTKTHKNKKIDTLIPAIGIIFILITYIEGMFQVFIHNVGPLMDKIREIINEMPQ